MLKAVLIVCLNVILGACGYHLRGDSPVPEVLKHIYLQEASPRLTANFQEIMRLSSAKLSEKPEANGVILHVLNERFDRRSSSITATGKTNEYQLVYLLEYEVLSPDSKLLIPRQGIEINRNYYNDQQAVVGKEMEENMIREEMYRQAVRSILDRGKALIQGAQKK